MVEIISCNGIKIEFTIIELEDRYYDVAHFNIINTGEFLYYTYDHPSELCELIDDIKTIISYSDEEIPLILSDYMNDNLTTLEDLKKYFLMLRIEHASKTL
jgi:hypothetical protein